VFFDSFSALLYMDGHGSYVWFCYSAAVIVLAVVAVAPARRSRASINRIRTVVRRERAAKRSEI
jgi:heme exporter protein D